MFDTKEKILNFVYSIGAAIVILGALVKITHISIPGISGNVILGVGLAVECLIFVLFAFNPPVEETKYAWENVYPELLDSNVQVKSRKAVETTQIPLSSNGVEASLSERLDQMLAEAKIDVAMFERLKTGIDKFSTSIDQMNQSAEQSEKFNEELKNLTNNLNNLNKVYGNMLTAMKS
ncbi:MAG: gliding motility protein GldL [Flavobacteriaceae bacterium]|nr:gliding motility protein GldL [Flavobacteriaceae bacterium]